VRLCRRYLSGHESLLDRGREVVELEELALAQVLVGLDDRVSSADRRMPLLELDRSPAQPLLDELTAAQACGKGVEDRAHRGRELPVAQEHDLPLLGEVPEERPGRQPGALGDLRDRRLCVPVLGEQGHGGFFEDEGGIGGPSGHDPMMTRSDIGSRVMSHRVITNLWSSS